jgi:hypothetical protein
MRLRAFAAVANNEDSIWYRLQSLLRHYETDSRKSRLTSVSKGSVQWYSVLERASSKACTLHQRPDADWKTLSATCPVVFVWQDK